MDDIDWELCGIYGTLNALGGVILLFLFCALTHDWDLSNRTIGMIIGGTFAVLSTVEFLCWLFHIPEWIRKGLTWICKGLTWIRQKTDPEE